MRAASAATQLAKVSMRHAGVQLGLKRLRQVFETHAMDQHTPAEQEAASRAQAGHSSTTARLHCNKRLACALGRKAGPKKVVF